MCKTAMMSGGLIWLFSDDVELVTAGTERAHEKRNATRCA